MNDMDLEDKKMTNWWRAGTGARRNGAKFRYCTAGVGWNAGAGCGMTRGRSPKRAPRVLGFEFYEWCCVEDGHRRQRSTTTTAAVFHTGGTLGAMHVLRGIRSKGFPRNQKPAAAPMAQAEKRGGGVGGPVSWSLSSRSRTKPLQVTECGVWT